MRPRLAIVRHSAPDDEGALALACEGTHAGIEATLLPSEIEASVLTAAALKSRGDCGLDVRYHFPLGEIDISGPTTEAADAATHALVAAVRAISLAGGDYLTVHAALPSDSRGTHRFRETRRRLAEIVNVGLEHGVTVALENLRWGATSEPSAFLDIVEGTGCAVTLDVGHAVSSESAAHGHAAERFIADCGRQVRSAHVYDRETDRHHPPTDLDRIGGALDALCDVGCGWWTIELVDPSEVRVTRELLTGYLDARYPLAPCLPV